MHKPPRPEKKYPKEYKVTIYKLDPRYSFGLRYEAVIEWSILTDSKRYHREPAFTLWGARKAANKWIEKQRAEEIEPVEVESYTL